MANMLPLNERQAIMQEPCQGCFYFSGWSCDYILLEKKRRPCRPGDDCTVRKKRGLSGSERLAVINRQHNRLPAKPVGRRDSKPYTVQVKNPRPVIKAKPATKTVFNQTKKAEKPKKPKEPKAPARATWEDIRAKLDTPEIIGLYDQGHSDADIGKVVGCAPNSVRKWRIETGRPPNSAKGPKSRQKRLENHLEDIKAALAAGVTTNALAERYGVHRETVRRFRIIHGLGTARDGRKSHGNEG